MEFAFGLIRGGDDMRFCVKMTHGFVWE